MKLTLEKNCMKDYFESSNIIDYEDDGIQKIASQLSSGLQDETAIIKVVYEYVRDSIQHSFNVNGKVVTCKASEVLKFGEGICYAKSHLLAAILRFLKVPTGFCYQKLILEDDKKPWLVLHGLNAVYVKCINKWVRVDPRGNKEGVNAEFCLDKEKLAFPIRKTTGEEDILMVYSEPNINVIKCLTRNDTDEKLLNDLPREL